MTGVLRLTLISHAMTEAMAAARFPDDEPLSDIGRRQARGTLDGTPRRLAAPERRARQTAELLGLQTTMEPQLADLDCGRWRGQALQDVPAAELALWLTDPAAAPHGGESVVNLIDRVAGWLASLSDDTTPTLAVTHPAVVRAAIVAALDTPPTTFWRIDVPPASRTVLHFRADRWTLRL
ncbi:histidine phosphatase family protein [Mycobacterium sp. 1423905.2]|uniref:histidine phosphatase family protein n=1 Tax=Mycobacterium sp. 1423905.2 TaxID=1856859 RepID=UPI0007FCC6A5|nr:histidine phosphatase family protein [Mycobacterium sp. 1423905.2]OBJ47235.1 histidine phosphatase [Mycobacterium sp. 1423905.2]